MLMLKKRNYLSDFLTSQQWDFNPILSVMNPVRAVCLGILLIVAEPGKLILHKGYMMFLSNTDSFWI